MQIEPLTVDQIVDEVSTVKPMSKRTVYLNISRLGVRPIAEVQQHPQLYPGDTAARILKRYGLKP